MAARAPPMIALSATAAAPSVPVTAPAAMIEDDPAEGVDWLAHCC